MQRMNRFLFVVTVTFFAVFVVSYAAAATPQTLRQDHPAAPPVDAAKLAGIPRGGFPRNIILIIGDGMGQGAINFASLHAHGAPGRLSFEQFPVRGLARTASADSRVTDSAASGTALACGRKTNNGMIGMTPDRKKCRSVAELARATGRAVGVMTSDQLTGATPAAFLAHVPSRKMAQEIAADMASSGVQALIGAGARPFLPEKSGGVRKDGRDLIAELHAAGYVQAVTPAALRQLPADRPVFGFVEDWSNPELLAGFATVLCDRLGRDPEGFFLMVEGCDPDRGGHSNDPDRSAHGVLSVDFLARAALDYALAHPDTLVVVTADHETGGISAAPNRENPRRPFIAYSAKGHTGNAVDIFAFGPGADRFRGVLENTDIPKIFAELFRFRLDQP